MHEPRKGKQTQLAYHYRGFFLICIFGLLFKETVVLGWWGVKDSIWFYHLS